MKKVWSFCGEASVEILGTRASIPDYHKNITIP
jgi:hypothetical protein